MAYIPDDAIDRSSDLSPSAFRLYCLICRRRNHRTGYALLNPRSIENSLQLSRGQTWRAIKELKDQLWITVNEPFFVPLLGDFSPVNKHIIFDEKPPPKARKNVTNARKNVTNARKNARVHNILLPALSNQPFSTKPETGTKNKKCSHCKDGVMKDKMSGKEISCFSCDRGAAHRDAVYGESRW